MPDVHLTDDQLTALRDGALWNPVVVSHLRSCSACQTRLREARLLRVLLARPEQRRSAHPKPEALAAYLEGQPASTNLPMLEAHVAGCVQCFADLRAIQTHMRPAVTPTESAPDWLITAATRQFEPPTAPLKLGSLIVEWLRGVGFSLELSLIGEGPSLSGEDLACYSFPAADSVQWMPRIAQASARMERIADASWPGLRSMERGAVDLQSLLDELMRLREDLPAQQADELRNILAASPDLLEVLGEQTAELQARLRVALRSLRDASAALDALVARAKELRARESTTVESEPVMVNVADLRITIRVRGRAPAQVKMAVTVNRRQDDTSVPGVRLVLKTEGKADVTATADASGAAEIPLPQGQATLVFESPVHAELKISF
jgi:hypothetical protein